MEDGFEKKFLKLDIIRNLLGSMLRICDLWHDDNFNYAILRILDRDIVDVIEYDVIKIMGGNVLEIMKDDMMRILEERNGDNS